MSIVRVVINEPTLPTDDDIKKFRADALRELANLKDADEEIFCDADCPELTDEQLERLLPFHLRQEAYRTAR